MKREKVLVTGSTGFIGTKLVEYEDIEVVSFNRPLDVVSKNDFDKFKNIGITHVYHLAAKLFVPDSWENPSEFYKINVIGTENVLEFCREENISLTYISSYMYGKPEYFPINEEHPIHCPNPYAHSKYLAEQLCHFYMEHFNLRIAIIRPFNIYGINQKNNFLIQHIINEVYNNKEIHVMDLRPKRDYLYVDDLVKLLIQTRKKKACGIFNAGSGGSLSVSEVIEVIQKEFGTSKKIVASNVVRKNEINDVVADICKAEKELGWKPEINFQKGIKKIVKSMKKREG